MNIDNFNQRITIQKRTITKVKGIQTDKWDIFYSCYCSVNSLYGTELYKALEISQENVLNFTVRYTKILENLNTKDFRVVWKDRNFNMIATDYFGFSKEKIIIKAKEVL
ncbi:phage head closure protein [Clostridium sp. C2-6-12]|uniref:phage head closure protein n=1 Tax=Clostridium sp. C2-6-12 TaxID=2698832 RepID=UPI00136A9E8D|nr:phage head closure protein [Clostridium sp. C2-6-12]